MSRDSVYEVVAESAGSPVCACCPRPLAGEDADGGWLVCRRCQAIIAGRLGEVLALWPEVDRLDRRKGSHPADSGGGGSAGPGGSQAPGDLAVISLVSGEVVQRLEVHEDGWREARGWSGRPPRGRPGNALAGVCRFLGDNLLWACANHPAVADLDQELRRLVGQMQAAVTGERRHVVTLEQTCPYTAPGWEDGDPEAPACGGTLRCDITKRLIRCADCWAQVPPENWLELGITVGSIAINQERAA